MKLDKATPYMLRNDGDIQSVSPLHPYIKYGYESGKDALPKLCDTRFAALEWFYNNTLKHSTKNLIEVLAYYLRAKGLISENKAHIFNIPKDEYVLKDEEAYGVIEELTADTNQEFCRFRTSSLLLGGASNEIYFRISSIRFNWFDLIWELVYKHRDFVSDVTICKDSNTFGGRYTCYHVGSQEIKHLPTKEFIMLSGNPVIERLSSSCSAISTANNELQLGKTISEAYSYLHPVHAVNFYNKQVCEVLDTDMMSILKRGIK